MTRHPSSAALRAACPPPTAAAESVGDNAPVAQKTDPTNSPPAALAARPSGVTPPFVPFLTGLSPMINLRACPASLVHRAGRHVGAMSCLLNVARRICSE